MCGADRYKSAAIEYDPGSPPRVRSRLDRAGIAHLRKRITSACAEQTVTLNTGMSAGRDHLRVCGADLL